MKRAIFLALVLAPCLSVLANPACAETPEAVLTKVWKKLGADQPIEGVPVRLHLHISDKDEVNAWTTPTTGDIYVTRDMLNLVGKSEGELAFILVHEFGHVVGYWSRLSTQAQQAQMEADLSGFLSKLNLLFESEEDRKNRYSHVEENLADAIGLYALKEAGYNPYDAGAFFGRFQMYAGTTDPATRMWNSYRDTHPFTEDRVENSRRVLARLQESEAAEAKQESGYIWIGNFAITIVDSQGQRQETETTDALGIYTEDDFREAQAMEVDARKELIRKFLQQKYPAGQVRILRVELKSIERELFRQEAQREKWPR